IGLLAAMATLTISHILGGKSLIKSLIFPICFLLLAIPWPTFLEQGITLPLMTLVTTTVGEAMLLIGVPAQISGTTIVLPGCIVGIEEACSGLHSFQTALILSLAAGELYYLTIRRRIGLVIFAISFAFLGNIARTGFLTWQGSIDGKPAIEHWHDTAALIFLVILVGGIFLAAIILKPRVSRQNVDTSSPAKKLPLVSMPRVGALWIIAFGGFISAQGWYALHGTLSKETHSIIADRGGKDPAVEITTVPASVLNILRPTEGTYLQAQDPAGLPMSAYHFYWAPSRTTAFQVYHRPDICMPGVGWKLAGEITRISVPFGNGAQSWYVFPYERYEVRAFLLWNALLDGKPMELPFDHKASIQRNVSLRFILNGKKEVSYEVSAILIPYEGVILPLNVATDAINLFFTPR
ncbi:MAG: exosortase/archaeosortase family protein, partial [Chthoniobacterales bacterium]